jgi:phosphoribosylformimino-5-aminoimidazole carboxamide ribotide isomerase
MLFGGIRELGHTRREGGACMADITLYPALDVLGGHVTRVVKGDDGETRILDEDPIAVVTRWREAGAAWLHVVDLDGVRDGHPGNLDVVRRIVDATGLSVQLAGGLGQEDAITAAFEAGAARALLSLTAVRESDTLSGWLERWGERIAVSVDARGEQQLVAGWLELLSETEPALSLAQKLLQSGVQTLVLTGIARKRMTDDSGVSSLSELRTALQGKTLIAAGDIATLDDIRWLRNIGFDGAVLGRALYEGTLDLAEALAAARSAPVNSAPTDTPTGEAAQPEDASQG